MVEENQEQKQKLKKMREKFGTVYGSDEDNKNVYRNAIFELDKEIKNKLGKIDELKIELNKQKANDDKAQEQINNIYNKIKQKQNNILINDDLFKFQNDDTNGNKDNKKQNTQTNKNNVNTNKQKKNNNQNVNNNINNNKNIKIINNNNNNYSNNIIKSNININDEKKNNDNELDISSNQRKPKFTISFKSEEKKINNISIDNNQNQKKVVQPLANLYPLISIIFLL